MAQVCKGTMKRQWRGSRGDKPCRQILFSSLHFTQRGHILSGRESRKKPVHFASYCFSRWYFHNLLGKPQLSSYSTKSKSSNKTWRIGIFKMDGEIKWTNERMNTLMNERKNLLSILFCFPLNGYLPRKWRHFVFSQYLCEKDVWFCLMKWEGE